MIELNHVEKYYNRGKSNEIHVINDVTLELPDRGMVAVFGRSGCGKTTLLNVIGGLDGFSNGSIKINGNDVSHNVDDLRNLYIGYIFQNYNLNKEETVFENVADALTLCGVRDKKEIEERVNAALDAVDMARYAGRIPDTLSGGQQQRVAIARAIVKSPRVILADEPTGNLDEANTVMIMDLLHEIAKDHLVILVTHEENLVDHYCETVVELADGKIVNTRTNERASGYSAKDKNTIYLGEYEKSETKSEAVEVEYYGDKPRLPVRIKVVNVKGKIYLKIDSDGVHYLDRSSEIKLESGVFESKDKPVEKNSFSDLPPLKYAENARIGRLFGFKSSIVSGFRSLFDKRKKGRGFLRVVMSLFAVVFTFMVSGFATAIGGLIAVNERFDSNVFYVFAESEDFASKFKKGENGIDGITMEDYNVENGMRNYYFMIGAFETADLRGDVNVSATRLDLSVADGLRVLSGRKNAEYGEVVITSAVADKVISTLNVSYIKKYSDFLGLSVSDASFSFGPYYYDALFYGANDNSAKRRIAGVVDSSEPAIFFNSADIASSSFSSMSNVVAAASSVADIREFDVPLGTALYLTLEYGDPFDDQTGEDPPLDIGDEITIRGKTFAVQKVALSYDPSYSDALLSRLNARKNDFNTSFFLLNDEDASSLSASFGKTDAAAYELEYYFDYYEVQRSVPHGGNARYLALHTTDPAATERYIKSVVELYKDPFVYSPSYFYEKEIEGAIMGIVTSFIAMAIMFTILVLCMYFIMRSSMMSRIKEIGIYRAIGAKKSNVVFRFFVESLVLITLTVLIGYLASSAFLVVLGVTSTMISSMFYYPFWFALVVLIVLYGVCSLCGVLPILGLLRKTPSEILSKYDV